MWQYETKMAGCDTGCCGRLVTEEHRNLYSSPNIIIVVKSRMGWAEHVARMGAIRNVYTILVEKPEGKKRQRGRPGRKWEDNIRMDLTALFQMQ
jgi:hypothetical protein